MSTEQDLDRNEAATPHKLSKAKEKGQVSKSPDAVSAAVWVVAVAFLMWHGEKLVFDQFRFDQNLFRHAANLDPGGGALWPLISSVIREGMTVLTSFFIVLMIAGVLANVVQTGPVLSTEPLKFDFSRLNPVDGFKKVFSMRTLFDTGRALIKLTLLTLVSYYALKSLKHQFYALANMSAHGYLKTLLSDLGALGLKTAAVLVFIALVDLAYTRFAFDKKMRMSRRELKDENKQRDGDPRIKSRLRELRREALKRTQALQQTRNADVVLTNPTHVAVALRYQHDEMSSPQLVAKGAGELAAAMREIAGKHRIPIVQNPALARQLFRELEVSEHVPQSLYAEVARIIVWVFAMREKRASAPVPKALGLSGWA